MKRLLQSLLFSAIISISYNSYSQVYTEDFNTGGTTWTINTVTGGEGILPNQWWISCQEEGVGAGFCGTGCTTGDNTLHVGPNVGVGDLGAAYAEAGAGTTTTNRRAESGNINTVGETGMTLSFDFIGWGGNPNDYTELEYSIDGGGSWITLDPDLQTNCCGDVACTGTLQGLWVTNNYLLPSSCEGITNLRIAFHWHNLDDLIATDPSFAVDNISITTGGGGCSTPPTASFTPAADVTICAEDGLTFTDGSTTCDVISDWDWTFGGGSPAFAVGPGPHSVSWSTPGVYTVSLSVTDGVGTDDTTFTITVEAEANAGLDNSSAVCNSGGILDVNTLLVGADAGGVWTETTSSGSFTPGTGEFDYTGVTAGIYIFEYTITPVACSPQTATMTVTVEDGVDAGADGATSACDDGTTVDVNTLLSGADPGGFWVETTSSGSFVPATGILTVTGLTPGVYLFDYMLTGTAPCPDDIATISVTVEEFKFAGADSAITVCDSDGTMDLFSALGGSFDTGGSWNDDDATGALTGSSLDLLTPPAPGTYNFTYTQDNTDPCADDNATVTVSIVYCLSIDEHELSSLNIHPNPVLDKIDLSSFDLEIQKVELFTAGGQLVRKTTSDQMDVSTVAAGAYILRVTTANRIYNNQILKE